MCNPPSSAHTPARACRMKRWEMARSKKEKKAWGFRDCFLFLFLFSFAVWACNFFHVLLALPCQLAHFDFTLRPPPPPFPPVCSPATDSLLTYLLPLNHAACYTFAQFRITDTYYRRLNLPQFPSESIVQSRDSNKTPPILT